MAALPDNPRNGDTFGVSSHGGILHNGTRNFTHYGDLHITYVKSSDEQFDQIWGDRETIIRSANPIFDDAIPIKLPLVNKSMRHEKSLDSVKKFGPRSAKTRRRESQKSIETDHLEKVLGLDHDLTSLSEAGAAQGTPEPPEQVPLIPQAEEASRPYHQFMQQLRQERQRMISDAHSGWNLTSPGINTEAAARVKESWKNHGIWNDRWGTLPGMAWKHETTQTTQDNMTRRRGLASFLTSFRTRHRNS
ncbi:hypothetical protein GLAREA_04960 [Glarea lozoyensis ATCC 20868]|uniref:Uncharacterized protein n=1 Tax=Glarea lozoyensis (strain ATCC 20868 / MF5171) TaxID=1116229 RepID=S3CSW9_GLAL2|nr:uncharacterized protein GLAREA_04960 [Glarea lozoyensis ATCC 20868]EPE28169.1 hypothetical protein GLAREA_04960 [Glarea lozoyensis ATCC 20868]